MIPGIMPVIAGGLSGPSSLVFVDSVVANSNSLAIPSAAEAGDLGVWVAISRGASTPSLDAPNGWTLHLEGTGAASGGNGHGKLATRVLTAEDLGTSVVNSGNGTTTKALLIFRPDRPITAVTASAGAYQTTANKPSDQVVTSTEFDGPGVTVVGAVSSSISVSSSLGFTGETTTVSAFKAFYLLQDDPVSDPVIAMADGGTTNSLMSIFIDVD